MRRHVSNQERLLMKFAFTCVMVSILVFLLYPVAVSLGQDNAQAELKRGEEVYKSRCLGCHLPEGKARVKRLNLADNEWRHGGSLKDIEKVVMDGVPGTAMMAFKDVLPREDVTAVAKYVMKLSEAAGQGSSTSR
jgi:mono/diheme cytochrome c family protein